jgi:hypothetical protein
MPSSGNLEMPNSTHKSGFKPTIESADAYILFIRGASAERLAMFEWLSARPIGQMHPQQERPRIPPGGEDYRALHRARGACEANAR